MSRVHTCHLFFCLSAHMRYWCVFLCPLAVPPIGLIYIVRIKILLYFSIPGSAGVSFFFYLLLLHCRLADGISGHPSFPFLLTRKVCERSAHHSGHTCCRLTHTGGQSKREERHETSDRECYFPHCLPAPIAHSRSTVSGLVAI